MFHSTQPDGSDPLMRVSEFERDHAAPIGSGDAEAGATRLSALNPSLLQDLLRFEQRHRPGAGLDLLEVMAAALRHNRALLLHLQLNYRVIPLTVLPASRQVHSPLQPAQWLALRLPDLRVLRVEPARAPEAGVPPSPLQALAPLLWELALRGARADLLPEISGIATYRVGPGADLRTLDMGSTMATAVARLRVQTTPLHHIAAWEGFDRDRATRLLNALYLQSALIVSRSHPGAVSGL
jgi:hypothetical protein